MKTRSGFVSNSSSSSFICDICGEIESGMEASMTDFAMVTCVNGHTFHMQCAHIDDTTEAIIEACGSLKKFLIDRIKERTITSYYTAEDMARDLNDMENEDDDNEVLQDACHEEICENGVPECLCPLCRLEDMTNDDMLNYMLKHHGVTKVKVIEEVNSRFQNYKSFINFLTEEN